jgi:uncharacterized membrane protein
MKNLRSWIFVALLSILPLVSAQTYDDCFGFMGGMMGSYGYGFFAVFMWIFWILVLVALILLIAWLVKQLQGGRRR